MNDKLNELAAKIYNAHKEAFDFIFDNRPDPSTILYPKFAKENMDSGFVIGSKNKGYVRFTTQALKEILPNNGQGWPGKEVFLFEIDYFWNKNNAIIKAVIAPCDESIRDGIHNAVKESKYYKQPIGKKWLVIYQKKIPFVASEIINEDQVNIKGKIKKIIEEFRLVVEDISDKIVKKYVHAN